MLWRSFAATGRIKVNAPTVSIMSAGANDSYWMATSDGGIFSMGSAKFYGSAAGKSLTQPIASARPRPQHDGYWLLGGDGGVFAYGSAAYHGRPPTSGITGFYRAIVPTATGNGYWVISQIGNIFPFGDAVTSSSSASSGYHSINTDIANFNKAYGGLAGVSAGGIVSAASTGTGHGLILVSDNGSVYAYGDAVYRGNAGINYAAGGRAADIMANGSGSSGGYVIVGIAGKVFAFNAPLYGDARGISLSAPITGIAYTPSAKGYWLAGQDGGVFTYGDAVFQQALVVQTHTCWDGKAYPLSQACPIQPPPPPPTKTTTGGTSGSTGTGSTGSGSSSGSSSSSGGSSSGSSDCPQPGGTAIVCATQYTLKSQGENILVDGLIGSQTIAACGRHPDTCYYITWPGKLTAGTSPPKVDLQKLADSFEAGSVSQGTYTASSGYTNNIDGQITLGEGNHRICLHYDPTIPNPIGIWLRVDFSNLFGADAGTKTLRNSTNIFTSANSYDCWYFQWNSTYETLHYTYENSLPGGNLKFVTIDGRKQ